MQVTRTALDGVLIVEPDVFGDARGWFYESYSKIKLEPLGITADFVQDNHALSRRRHTLRGLHFQKPPHAQAKLVRCTQGEILDVAVDIRRGSPSFCRWVSVVLSGDNKRQLYIPAGFAHGYLTLTDTAEVQYKADACYAPAYDRSVRYDDPAFGIDWGIEDAPALSDRDRAAPLLADTDNEFIWRGDAP